MNAGLRHQFIISGLLDRLPFSTLLLPSAWQNGDHTFAGKLRIMIKWQRKQ